MLVHEIIDTQATRLGGAVALRDGQGAVYTWADLVNESEAVADALYAEGIRQGDRVAVLSKNRAGVIPLYIAASRLGAIYMPINYRFAPREVSDFLRFSQPRLLLCHGDFVAATSDLELDVETFSFCDGSSSTLTSLDELSATAPKRNYRPDIQSDDVSWVCFTGGTTGRSKGAMLTHDNMVASSVNFIVANRIAPDDIYLAAGALFHIALVVPFAYWVAGASVVVMDFEAEAALDVIDEYGVTQMIATGSILNLLVEAAGGHDIPRGRSLRNVDTGGAPVALSVARAASDAFMCSVGQIYGQTEATLMATYLAPESFAKEFRESNGEEPPHAVGSVGQQAPICAVRVLDDSGAEVPVGSVGEICVAGPNVMKGYLDQPELTRETLVNGWLRTGDLGRQDDMGRLYLVDRKKDMIISGGENVYCGEVERVIIEHPSVQEAVVFGVPDPQWGESVQAVVVLHVDSEADVDEEELRRYCREWIAGYKVPKRIHIVNDLPRLPTGKVAKGRLRSEYGGAHGGGLHAATRA